MIDMQHSFNKKYINGSIEYFRRSFHKKNHPVYISDEFLF